MRSQIPFALLWLTILIVVAVSAVVGIGCDPESSEPDAELELRAAWRPLVTADGWEELRADADPLPEHRPAEVVCSRLGWYAETDGLEVDTSACNYLAVEHASLEALRPGDVVRVELWWQSLISLEPAEGHLAVWLDGQLLWEERVAIPGYADARDVRVPITRFVPAGAPVIFHLHNHGTNTWRLRGLSVLDVELAADE
ncbi:MAG: hypothetical protein H6713_14595 [Myxococcales bacterium]|nr:hypothetical protein [Myxococcales bacterium]